MVAFKPRYETLLDIFQHSVAHYADRPLFGIKRRGAWTWISYAEFGRSVDSLRTALADLGVGAGDRVAIIADNRPEWASAAYATYGRGAAFVAMYEAQLEAEWLHVLRDSRAKVLFVPGQVIARRIEAHRGELPELRALVVLEGPTEAGMLSYGKLLEDGARRATPVLDVTPDDVACVLYTSGTYGVPKGVLLTHGNVARNVSAIHEVFPVDANDRSVCFLPWAHVFGQTVELHGTFSLGASMGLTEGVDHLLEDVAELRPTLLVSVPRIWALIHRKLTKRGPEGSLKQRLFRVALENERLRRSLAGQRRTSGVADLKHVVFDDLVFAKIRERLGGRLRFAISGGAALAKDVAEFVDDLGITVFEGYGLTETSPIVAANYPGARKLGSVGKCVPGVRVEIDTAVTGDPKHGEIVVFGHGVMRGYEGLPEEDARVFVQKGDERGVRTGDLGYVDGEGFLHVTGRIKEQYKLSNGKYVVPTPLEDELVLSPYVASAMIFGADKEFNVAVIVPDFAVLTAWARSQGITGDAPSLVTDERVRALFASELERCSTGFRPYERVRRFVLGTVPFGTDNDMLTPTMKLKRTKVLETYGAELDALYA